MQAEPCMAEAVMWGQEEGLELCMMDKGHLRYSLWGSSFTSKPFRTENKTLCVATQEN